MRKNVRLILSVVMLVCITGALIFGVIAITRDDLGVANTTTYKFATGDVFVEVSGEYSGPELDAKYNKTYSGKVENSDGKLESWSLGDIMMSNDEPKVSITFCFKNLNVTSSLQIAVSGYMYDSQQRILSYYKTGATEADVENDDYRILIESPENAVGNLTIGKKLANESAKEVWIRFTFEAVKFDKNITDNNLLDNSLEFTFTSISE